MSSRQPPNRLARKEPGAAGAFSNLVLDLQSKTPETTAPKPKRVDAAMFTYHDKLLQYSKRSLFCLSQRSKLRRGAVWLVNWPPFERGILLLILLNSITLGITDTSAVDIQGNLLIKNADGSANMRNTLVTIFEPFFVAVFAVEAMLKIVAMGFFARFGYIRNGWNIVDFFVTCAAIVGELPGVPNISAVRVSRVLRPLRSLTVLPGMRLLVSALIRALPALASVLLLLAFMFGVFGILGLQMYAGRLDGRCRLTEYPVRMAGGGAGVPDVCVQQPNSLACLFTIANSTTLHAIGEISLDPQPSGSLPLPIGYQAASKAALVDPETYLSDLQAARQSYPYRIFQPHLGFATSSLLNASMLAPCIPNVTADDPDWPKHRSPWHTPRDCWWPVDPLDEFACSEDGSGRYQCLPDRVCGRNYDPKDNPRFSQASVQKGATFTASRLWGMVSFNNLLESLATLFQVATLEGWTAILYIVSDSNEPVLAGIVFIAVVFIVALFALNLTLAALWDSFKRGQDEERLLRREKKQLMQELKDDAFREEIERLKRLQREFQDKGTRLQGKIGKLPGSARGRLPSARMPYLAPLPPIDEQKGLRQRGADGEHGKGAVATARQTYRGEATDRDMNPFQGAPPSRDALVVSARSTTEWEVDATLAANHVPSDIPLEEQLRLHREHAAAMGLDITPPDAFLAIEDADPTELERALQSTMIAQQDETGLVLRQNTSSPTHTPATVTSDTVDNVMRIAPKPPRRKHGRMSTYLMTAARHKLQEQLEAEREPSRLQRIRRILQQWWDRPYDGGRLQDYAKAIERSPWFHVIIIAFIVINTIILCLDRYPMDRNEEMAIEAVNFTLTVLFLLEMILYIGAEGVRGYLSSTMRRFDAFIVLVSIAELFATPPTFISQATTSHTSAVTVLRTLRLFRIFRLARKWKALNVLLKTMVRTVWDVANFGLLLLIFVYIFALVGMQVFGSLFCFNEDTGEAIPLTARVPSGPDGPDDQAALFPCPGEVPRVNFDNLFDAMLLVFQVITLEDWTDVLASAWRASGWAAFVYFVPLVFLGQYVVVDLFEAVLLGNFEQLSDVVRIKDAKKAAQAAKKCHAHTAARNEEPLVAPEPERGPTAAGHVKAWADALMRADSSKSLSSTARSFSETSRTNPEFFNPLTKFENFVSRDDMGSIYDYGSIRIDSQDVYTPRGTLPELRPVSTMTRLRSSLQNSVVSPMMRAMSVWRSAAFSTRQASMASASGSVPSNHGAGLPQVGAVSIARAEPRREERKVKIAFTDAPKVAPIIIVQDDTGGPGNHPDPSDAHMHQKPAPTPAFPPNWDTDRDAGVTYLAESARPLPRPPSLLVRDILSGNPQAETASARHSARPSARISPKEQAPVDADPKVPDHGDQNDQQPDGIDALLHEDIKKSTASRTGWADLAKWRHRAVSKEVPQTVVVERTLYCCRRTNCVRKAISWIVHLKAFEGLVILMVILSSITLALDNPLSDPMGTLQQNVRKIDFFVTTFFCVEMVLKWVDMGLLFTETAYLRDPWSCLDGIIVIVSVISLAAEAKALRAFRVARALRAIRPLRLVRAIPGLRIIVNAVILSLGPILNVVLVCLLFFTIFAILFISQFKGTFWGCGGPSPQTADADAMLNLITYPVPFRELTATQMSWFYDLANITGNATVSEMQSVYGGGWNGTFASVAPTSRQVCSFLGFGWVRTTNRMYFDNVAWGMQALLSMSTTEGWVDVMHASSDAVAIDMQPIPNYNQWWSLLSVLVILVLGLFITKLFIAVVLDTYNDQRARLGGSAFLSPEQREWLKTQKVLFRVRPLAHPKPPAHPLRRFFFDIVMSEHFDTAITVCVLVNTLLMAMPYVGESDAYSVTLEAGNDIFAFIFTLEAIARMAALGVTKYLADSQNIFDLCVVLASNVGIVLFYAGTTGIGVVPMIGRILRIGRVLRLFRRAKSLKHMMQTLVLTWPSLLNTGSLLLVVLYVYAVIGVQLFADVQWGAYLDRHNNFQNFFSAVLLLIRAFTGEAFEYIQYDTATENPQCVQLQDYDYDLRKDLCGYRSYTDYYDGGPCIPVNGCGSNAAYVYFLSFIIFVSFIFINLLVSVILDGFAESEDDAQMQLSEDHFRSFANAWVRFDPDATLYIDANDLTKLIKILPEPMGYGDSAVPSLYQLRRRIAHMHLPIYWGNKVHFLDLAMAVSKKVLIDEARRRGRGHFDLPTNDETKMLARQTNRKRPMPFEISDLYAAQAIQRAWKVIKKRKEMLEKDMASYASQVSVEFDPTTAIHGSQSVDTTLDTHATEGRRRSIVPRLNLSTHPSTGTGPSESVKIIDSSINISYALPSDHSSGMSPGSSDRQHPAVLTAAGKRASLSAVGEPSTVAPDGFPALPGAVEEEVVDNDALPVPAHNPHARHSATPATLHYVTTAMPEPDLSALIEGSYHASVAAPVQMSSEDMNVPAAGSSSSSPSDEQLNASPRSHPPSPLLEGTGRLTPVAELEREDEDSDADPAVHR